MAPPRLEDGELREQLLRLLAELDAPPSPNGPIRSPVDRFAHLPENVRAWVERLRQEDLDDLDRLLQGYRKTGTIVWFFKWLVIAVGSTFVATVAFGEKVAQTISWLRGS